MSLTKIGSIGINTGIQLAGVTTVSTLHVGSGVTLSSDGDGFFTGIITATFAGDGTSLTGVASTDNIRTNTNATFLQNINVSGTVTATSYAGSGANLTGIDTDLVSDTSPQLGGNLDVNTKNIVFGDSGGATDDRLTFGAGTDLSIYHDGSHSFIVDGGTGNLHIDSVAGSVKIRTNTNEDSLVCNQDGAVELYYDNTKRLETTNTGVTITGGHTGTIISGDFTLDNQSQAGRDVFFDQSADRFQFKDNLRASFGDDHDLMIYHDTNHSYIYDAGTGDLKIQTNGAKIQLGKDNGATCANFIPDGAVELYHNNTKMIETISTGTNIPDGKFAKFGNSNDMSMGHNTYNYITYTGADFLLTGDATNQIKLMPKSDEAAIICKPNAEVELFHDGTLQCETSANGLAFPNGKGIDFSATANGGANTISELLDDYEEGEWNPAFGNGLVASAYESNGQRGSFTKIGNFVHCTGILHLATASTQSGSVITITGLPFTAGDYSNIGAPSGGMQYFYQDGFYNSNGFTGVVSDTGTEMLLYRADTGAQLTGTSVNGGREIRFQVWYHTPT